MKRCFKDGKGYQYHKGQWTRVGKMHGKGNDRWYNTKRKCTRCGKIETARTYPFFLDEFFSI